MSHARARRHYRVAQKEVEQSTVDGYIIPSEYKGKLIGAAIVLAVILFLKGFIWGMLAGRSMD